ncbi:MAG: heme exporter protein CcmD [Pseudomonadales bacterium]|nr:heme exporter protein CcmD [Pseudomonadales bacterium]
MNWLDFGTHASYVWSVYGIALVIFATNVLVPMIRHRRLIQGMTQKNAMERQQS